MKLHSDALTPPDLAEAALLARLDHRQDVYIEDAMSVGSRSRQYGLIFYLGSYHGRRATNRRGKSDARAATWSAWGYVIAELFNRDPNAIIGTYKSPSDFVRQCEQMREHREKLDGKDALDFLKTLTVSAEK